MANPWERLRRRWQPPTVSVVVPVYNVEPYLAECLDSLLGQTLASLEVIAVDDGSTDGSATILRDYERRDRRVRVLTQANAGQGAARNAGVAVARGEFLMFVDSDDTVPRDALEVLVATLRRTGSDFCLGAARRFTHRRDLEVAWGSLVHDRDRLATTLDAFPDAMLDIIACNRLFRTAFWREQVPPFEPGIAYEDHVPMLAATVRARQFDVLARTVYRWRIRSDSSSTSQQKADLRNLQDRIAVKEQAQRLLVADASPLAYDAWVARTIDIDFQQFLRFALSASDEYRGTLQQALQTMFGRASDRALSRMRFAPKVRGWLGAQGAWDALEDAEEWLRLNGQLPPARAVGGRLVAALDPVPDFLAGVPERLFGLADHETPLIAVLRGACSRTEDGSPTGVLTLSGYAAVRGLETSTTPPDLTAWLVPDHDADGRMELPLTLSVDDWADSWAGDPLISYRHSRFDLRIDLADLATRPPGAWRLRLRIDGAGDGEVGGASREDGVHQVLDGSAVEQWRERQVGADGVAREVTLATDDPAGIAVVMRAAGAVASEPVAPAESAVEVHAVALDGTRVTLDVVAPGFTAADLEEAVLQGDELALPVLTAEATRGRTRLTFDLVHPAWGLPPTLVPRGGYRLLVGTPSVAARPAGQVLCAVPQAQVSDAVRLTARRRPTGALGLLVAPPLHEAERSPVAQHRLRSLARQPLDASLVLFQCGDGGSVDGDPLAIDRALARLRPDLRRVWGLRSGHVTAPDGADAVTVGSARWHDLLRTAGTLITDDELGLWFDRADGQRWLQTLQGHPDKSMGAVHERAQGLSPGRVARLLERRNSSWTALLAASPEAEALCREALGYDGQVLPVGLPRTDPLLAVDREATRADARRRLALDPDDIVVLYAPTYRDAQVGRVRSAPLPRDLDLAAVAGMQRATGRTRVLLRAHRFDAPDAAAWTRGTAVQNVTDYPRVAELLLAADVAILDYSALRFDWALTGKPAICFVPDLDAQQLRRPSLLPYPETAPGPIATTSAEVIDLLGDLAVLAKASAPMAAAVAQRFAPLSDGAAGERVVTALF
jgi:CDP-glycerol glycerophosphotransferase (TagB/SpsB family)